MMKRYGSVIGVNEAKKAEYKALHAAVWPECAGDDQCLQHPQLLDLSEGPENLMFFLFRISRHRLCRRHGEDGGGPCHPALVDVCKPCQAPLATRKEGEWWADMEEVFHHD